MNRAEAIRKSWTDERKQSLSESRKGEANPFFGKHHTDEAKAKMAQVGDTNPFHGKAHSDDFKRSLSERKKNRANKLYKYGVTDEIYRQRLTDGFRWCHKCKDFRPAAEFSGKNGMCKPHKNEYSRHRNEGLPPELRRQQSRKAYVASRDTTRKWRIFKKYGVTPEWYETKLSEQNGHCALCPAVVSEHRRYLDIDHDHITNEVRGLLCGKCNTAMERLDSVPQWAQKAQEYINSYGTRSASPRMA